MFASPPPLVLNLVYYPLRVFLPLSALFRRTFRLYSSPVSPCLLLPYTPLPPSFVVRPAEQPEISCLREQHRGAPTPRHDPNGESTPEAQSNPGVLYHIPSSTYRALTTHVLHTHYAICERRCEEFNARSKDSLSLNGIYSGRYDIPLWVDHENQRVRREVRRIIPDVRRRRSGPRTFWRHSTIKYWR